MIVQLIKSYIYKSTLYLTFTYSFTSTWTSSFPLSTLWLQYSCSNTDVPIWQQ